MKRNQTFQEALLNAQTAQIEASTREIQRAMRTQTKTYRRERPALITAQFYNSTAGVACLVLGGTVETLSIGIAYPNGVIRTTDYRLELISQSGQAIAQAFSSKRTQFSVAINQTVADNTLLRLYVTPKALDVHEAAADILPPLYCAFGVSLRVRQELLKVEPLYDAIEEE